MNPSKGYYSLIQYCPDLSRLEAANIGVVLFCPDQNFLRALTDRSNARIRRFFGMTGEDRGRIDALKRAIESRFETDARRFKTLRELQDFIATRANEIQLTEPRPMRVVDPQADLERLFGQLVGGEAHRERADAAAKVRGALATTFEREGLSPFLQQDITVKVRALHREITVPFGYRNGRFNLIQPASFQQDSRRAAESEACRYAVEGHSIHANSDPDLFAGELQLVVVAQFSPDQGGMEEVVRDILEENCVRFHSLERLDGLLSDIRDSIPASTAAELLGRKSPSTSTV